MYDNNMALSPDLAQLQAGACSGMTQTAEQADRLRKHAAQEIRFARSLRALAQLNSRHAGVLLELAQEHTQLAKRMHGYHFLLSAIHAMQQSCPPLSLPESYAGAVRELYFLLGTQAERYAYEAQHAGQGALVQLYSGAAAQCQRQQEQMLSLLPD